VRGGHSDEEDRLSRAGVCEARGDITTPEGPGGEVWATGDETREGGDTLTDTDNDLQAGEMARIMREAGVVFLRILAYTFAILLIATINGSTTP
jgi:hypothetical protein